MTTYSDRLYVPSEYLPPRELQLYHPDQDGLMQTPLDERGLVDVGHLIRNVKATIDPSYDWHSTFSDIHHLQWPSRLYDSSSDEPIDSQVFRNLIISKLHVPRIFHNWVHRITEPPPIPSNEVMNYRIEAQNVALILFRTIKHSKMKARRHHLDEEGFEDLLMQRFDTFATTFEQAKSAPKEFQLLDFETYRLEDTHDMVRIGTELGKFAIVATASRAVRQPLAA